ncbi:hypothetical protein HWV07_15550 [Natronomonas salina]|uniref:hypothetical protein n=1 Tax=Natronomonas salina TaxID=1710540 RepID=UPI0015B41A42|nr:hypothetical protein [Natronomonas salina]QLD90374.1 hypothetical protein HWV07_15550 [Natronomonas salina]
MPTLSERKDKSTTVHPRQTDYYITAKPPEVGFITYQIDQRALEYLTETCSYSDGDRLPWAIVHPLRQIRDLYTLDEGHPRSADPEEVEKEISVQSVESVEIETLIQYLSTHPDVVGDVGTFRTRLEQQDGSYATELRRDGYTPVETPGFESSGNDTLDRIAQQYFGEGTTGYITWNGDRIYEYIEVTDRDGETHQFPKIDGRLREGELYRLSHDLYERWGSEIGVSEVNFRRYEPDDDGFPNRWIGQRVGSPEPSLKQAESPRAFYYRTIAGRSHHAPGIEAEEAFEAACDYSLEVYKANFPTAVNPNDFEIEYVTVEKATEPWHDFQVPPGWANEYADNGGLPPLKRDEAASLSTRQQAVVNRHSPGGDGYQWFASRAEAIDRIENEYYADVMIAADQFEGDVIDFYQGGAGHPTFELLVGQITATVVVEDKFCFVRCNSKTRASVSFTTAGETTSGVNVDVDSVSEAGTLLEEVRRNLPVLLDFADLALEAM